MHSTPEVECQTKKTRLTLCIPSECQTQDMSIYALLSENFTEEVKTRRTETTRLDKTTSSSFSPQVSPADLMSEL